MGFEQENRKGETFYNNSANALLSKVHVPNKIKLRQQKLE